MNRKLWLAVILLCGVLSGCGSETRYALAGGGSTSLENWSGNWVVINYWAEWCAPCREEIPELNRLQAQAEAGQLTVPGAAGLPVYGVNYDGLLDENLSAVIERMDIAFPTLETDPQPELGYGRATVLPATVIVNPANGIHTILTGPQSAQSILAALAQTYAETD